MYRTFFIAASSRLRPGRPQDSACRAATLAYTPADATMFSPGAGPPLAAGTAAARRIRPPEYGTTRTQRLSWHDTPAGNPACPAGTAAQNVRSGPMLPYPDRDLNRRAASPRMVAVLCAGGPVLR